MCPILDMGPVLLSVNKLAVDIFRESQGSAARIEADRKTYLYMRPVDLIALFQIHEVAKDEYPNLMEKLYLIQEIANELRPKHKKPRKAR